MSLRLRLDANGTVSEAIPEDTSLPSSYNEAAIKAAKQIKFTPATEDGKQISTIAVIEYGRGGMAGEYVDRRTGRITGFVDNFAKISDFKIVAVEGAQETEGWRVIYE